MIATDDRVELVTEALLPDADLLVPGPIEKTLRGIRITEQTHIVLATRGTEVDVEALPLLLAGPARSIGVLGSRRRWRETRTELLARGAVAEQELDRVTAPIGLDLGAQTPREIALAIMGEILALRREPISRPPVMTAAPSSDVLVVLRGGGDLATGAAWRLKRAGFPVVVCELERPLTVRRSVAFSTALHDGSVVIEGVQGSPSNTHRGRAPGRHRGRAGGGLCRSAAARRRRNR